MVGCHAIACDLLRTKTPVPLVKVQTSAFAARILSGQRRLALLRRYGGDGDELLRTGSHARLGGSCKCSLFVVSLLSLFEGEGLYMYYRLKR